MINIFKNIKTESMIANTINILFWFLVSMAVNMMFFGTILFYTWNIIALYFYWPVLTYQVSWAIIVMLYIINVFLIPGKK